MKTQELLPSGRRTARLELEALRVAERIDPEILSLRNRLAPGEKIPVRGGIESGSPSFLGELWSTLGFFLTGRVERVSNIVLTCEGFQREALARYAGPTDQPRAQLETLPLRAVHFRANRLRAEELLIAAKSLKDLVPTTSD